MIDIVSALVPVFLVIVVGYSLRLLEFATDEAWRLVERVVYFVLFPALILKTIAPAELGSLQIIPMATALLAAIFTVAFVLTVLRRTLPTKYGMSGASYSSVFQGSLRWNGFVALAAVAALYGDEGVTIAALAIATLVPTVNVLSVVILTKHAADEPSTLSRILYLLIRNPLILSCAAGLFLNFTNIGLPGVIYPAADLLGSAALALGLLSVGAGLNLRTASDSKFLVGLATGLKLAMVPVLVAVFCSLFGVQGLAREVAILCAAVPTASSSYVLARQLGGDFTLMAAIITATTLAGLLTMPLALWILP